MGGVGRLLARSGGLIADLVQFLFNGGLPTWLVIGGIVAAIIYGANGGDSSE